jgi:tetratricopeptide (TPR) repeat protein
VDAGDGDLEIRRLRVRVAAEPENVTLRLDLAAAYQERGYPELTLEHARLAVVRFPNHPEAQLLLAKTLRSLGLRAQAAQGLEQFLQSNPQTSPKYASWLGILRDELGEWKAGESAHRAALSLRPSGWLHNNLGYNLLMQGRSAEAAEQFEAALRLEPSSVVARNNLGLALASKPAEAMRHWQSVSDPATAHSNLAALLIEQGKYAEARREIETALEYNRSHTAALRNLRLVAELDGKPATVGAKRGQGRWSRWLAGIRKAL